MTRNSTRTNDWGRSAVRWRTAACRGEGWGKLGRPSENTHVLANPKGTVTDAAMAARPQCMGMSCRLCQLDSFLLLCLLSFSFFQNICALRTQSAERRAIFLLHKLPYVLPHRTDQASRRLRYYLHWVAHSRIAKKKEESKHIRTGNCNVGTARRAFPCGCPTLNPPATGILRERSMRSAQCSSRSQGQNRYVVHRDLLTPPRLILWGIDRVERANHKRT